LGGYTMVKRPKVRKKPWGKILLKKNKMLYGSVTSVFLDLVHDSQPETACNRGNGAQKREKQYSGTMWGKTKNPDTGSFWGLLEGNYWVGIYALKKKQKEII